MGLSVIIPVYNEEKTIRNCLESLFDLEVTPQEIIVVDGGSTDATTQIAKEYPCRLLVSEKGRSAQLDFGARNASEELLCFLHADTQPNPRLVTIIEHAMSDNRIVLGGFRSILKGVKTRRIISFHNQIKTYYAPFLYNPYKTVKKGLRLLFGDQTMFCRKSDYLKSGGFDLDEKVMEEARFCLEMNKLGRVVQLKEKVYASDRRVIEWGVFKAHFLYIIICSAWALGVSSRSLAKLYPDIR